MPVVSEVEVRLRGDVKPLKSAMAEGREEVRKTAAAMETAVEQAADSIQKELGEAGKVAGQTGKQVKGLGDEAKKTARDAEALAREADHLQEELYGAKKAADLQGASLRSASLAYDLANGRIDETNRSLAEQVIAAHRATEALDEKARHDKANLDANTQRLSQAGENLNRVGLMMSAAFTAPLVLAGKAGIEAAMSYEKSAAIFKETSGASAAEMEKVRSAAVRLGNDIRLPATSANDAMLAMLELSKAGLQVTDTMAAAEGVLQMSAAAQIGNADAARIAGQTLNAFHLSGTQAVRVADLLAAAANASTASVQQLAEGLAQSSAVYASAGMSVENLVTAMAMMSNAGIQGSDAGTSLKTMLQSLVNPSDDAAKAMDRWRINIYDAQGKMISFRGIIAQFEKAMTGLTQKQRDQTLATIFGSDAVRGATVILGQGVSAYDAMEKATTRQGAAARMAAAANSGFAGSLDAAKSAGSTMLQGFLTPVLPALTSFFKWGAAVANQISGWPGPLKGAAVGLGVLLAVTGPTIVAFGSMASGIAAVVGLRGAFTAAAAAKAAATGAMATASGAATAADVAQASANAGVTTTATTAATAEVALATASGSAAGASTAAAGAGAAQASANAAVGSTAVAAAAGVRALFVSTAALVALAAVPIIFTIKYVREYQDVQAQEMRAVEGAAADPVTAQRFRSEWMQNHPGQQFDPQNKTFQRFRGNDRSEGARRKAAWARTQGPALPVLPKPNLDKDLADAIANMGRVPNVEPKIRKARGGGGAKLTDEQKAEKKAAQELAQEAATLRDRLYEATKANALHGKGLQSSALAYDLAHGKIKTANKGLAEQVVATLTAGEALDAKATKEKKAQEVVGRWKDVLAEQRKRMMLLDAKDERDRASIELYNKPFAQLTDPRNRARAAGAGALTAKANDLEAGKAAGEWAKETEAALRMELRTRGELTRVQKIQIELEGERGKLLSKAQKGGILDAAKALDDKDASDRLGAWKKQIADFWEDVTKRIRTYRAEQEKAAGGRFADAMQALEERTVALGSESEQAAHRTRRLAEAFGVGETAADRVASGMSRAKEVMAATLDVERAEAFRTEMERLTERVTDRFTAMFDDLARDGFGGFFSNVMTGFRGMLQDMAREYLASQIRGLVSRFVTHVIAGAVGGKGGQQLGNPYNEGPQYAAVGGPVLAGRPVVTGEYGPEAFVPSGNGRILTPAQTSKMTAPINVNITVHATDAGSFQASQGQIAQEMGRRVQAALRRNG